MPLGEFNALSQVERLSWIFAQSDAPLGTAGWFIRARARGRGVINPYAYYWGSIIFPACVSSLVYTPTICKNFDALAESSELSSSLFGISLARAYCLVYLGKQFQRGIHMSP